MKILMTLFLSLSLFACANQSSVQNKPSTVKETTLSAPNSFAPDLVPIIVETSDEINVKRQSKESIYFELGVIPGDLYGGPERQPRWFIDLYDDGDLNLNLTEAEENVSPYASEYNNQEDSLAFTISPSDTKLVRMSTFGVDFKEERYLSGGLKDEDGHFFFLAYFDRPCTITGIVDFGEDGIFDHQIVIPSAGLYRIGVHGNTDVITASKSNDPITVFIN